MKHLSCWFFCMLYAILHAIEANPEVNTTSGLVIGTTYQESHAFYSIPYAEAPVGNLRFKAPVPVTHRGILNKTSPDYVQCYEFPLNCDLSTDQCFSNYREDCLVLNVHVPSFVNLTSLLEQKIPVLVWIHGGGFESGSGTTAGYDGRWLANATSTVVVSLNYRLGALGFLVYEEGNESFDGNQGFKDQQLALQWVQNNIEFFGGDSNNITIYGESAGAQSVLLHLVSARSDPLFHRAIVGSPPATVYYPNVEESKVITQVILDSINCTGNGILCLKNVSPISLMLVQPLVQNRPPTNYFNEFEAYKPVIDGVELTHQPLDAFRLGLWQKHKPVIIGTTTDEGSMFQLFGSAFNETSFASATTTIVGPQHASVVIQEYEALLATGLSYAEILSQEIGDLIFVCPTRAIARYMSNTSQSSVFYYVHSYPLNFPSCPFVFGSLCGRPFHGSELLFIFDTGPLTGLMFDSNDTLVSNIYQNFWGNFAFTGMPSTSKEIWPPYISDLQVNGTISSWTNIHIPGPTTWLQNSYGSNFCDFWDSIGYFNINNPFKAVETSTQSSMQTTSKAVISCSVLYLNAIVFIACFSTITVISA